MSVTRRRLNKINNVQLIQKTEKKKRREVVLVCMLYHAQKNAYCITLKKTKEEMRIISHSKNIKEEEEEREKG